jgi:hypothetical protein
VPDRESDESLDRRGNPQPVRQQRCPAVTESVK